MRFIGQLPPEERQESGLIGIVLRPAVVRRPVFPKTLLACTLSALLPVLAVAATNTSATANPSESASRTQPQLVNSPLRPAAPDYSMSTDHELTRLGARWDVLSAPEREALLREVKLRMAQRKDADGVLMIRTQRRYGRVYRGNGRYLKIETKVVQVRPSTDTRAPKAGFGTGFEQRNAEPETRSVPVEGGQAGEESPAPLDAAMSPPVVRASDPSS